MNQKELNTYMNKKRPFLEIILSPSDEVMKSIREQYEFIAMTDDTYEDQDLWDKLYKAGCTITRHENITMNEIQMIAEPIRIDNPEQNVSITDHNGNYIGHTTWNDQIKYFFEYPVYTQRGLAIVTARQMEAIEQGVVASWE